MNSVAAGFIGRFCSVAVAGVLLATDPSVCLCLSARETLAPSSLFAFDSTHRKRIAKGREILWRNRPNIERGYDLRGVTTGNDAMITPAFAYTTAFALGQELCARIKDRRPVVLLTGDHRASTPALRRAFREGLMIAGVDVVWSQEKFSTPAAMAVAWLNGMRFDGMVQITASHNPWTGPRPENGFKVSIRDGHGVLRAQEGKDIAKILKRVMVSEAQSLRPKLGWGTAKKRWLMSQYISLMEKRFRALLHALGLTPADMKNFVLVVDSGNGVMAPVAKRVTKRCRISYCGVHDKVLVRATGHPAHPADPSQSGYYMRHLPQEVRRAARENPGKDVLGVCLDGDGDRVGLAPQNGPYLSASQLAYLFQYLDRSSHPGAAEVLDIRLGQEVVGSAGRNVLWHAPGDATLQAMQDAGAFVGVEGSQHVAMRPFDDPKAFPMEDGLWAGLYAAAHAVKLSKGHASIAEILSASESYPSLPQELRPDVAESVPGERYALVTQLASAVRAQVMRSFPQSSITVIPVPGEEGSARYQISDVHGGFIGWILIRASNTQHKLSILAQGRDDATMAGLAEILMGSSGKLPKINQADVHRTLAAVLPQERPASASLGPADLKRIHRIAGDAARQFPRRVRAQKTAEMEGIFADVYMGQPAGRNAGTRLAALGMSPDLADAYVRRTAEPTAMAGSLRGRTGFENVLETVFVRSAGQFETDGQIEGAVREGLKEISGPENWPLTSKVRQDSIFVLDGCLYYVDEGMGQARPMRLYLAGRKPFDMLPRLESQLREMRSADFDPAAMQRQELTQTQYERMGEIRGLCRDIESDGPREARMENLVKLRGLISKKDLFLLLYRMPIRTAIEDYSKTTNEAARDCLQEYLALSHVITHVRTLVLKGNAKADKEAFVLLAQHLSGDPREYGPLLSFWFAQMIQDEGLYRSPSLDTLTTRLPRIFEQAHRAMNPGTEESWALGEYEVRAIRAQSLPRLIKRFTSVEEGIIRGSGGFFKKWYYKGLTSRLDRKDLRYFLIVMTPWLLLSIPLFVVLMVTLGLDVALIIVGLLYLLSFSTGALTFPFVKKLVDGSLFTLSDEMSGSYLKTLRSQRESILREIAAAVDPDKPLGDQLPGDIVTVLQAEGRMLLPSRDGRSRSGLKELPPADADAVVEEMLLPESNL